MLFGGEKFMRNVRRKSIVFIIILLFIGAGVVPSIDGNVTFNDITDQEQQLDDDHGYPLCWNWTLAQSFIPRLNIFTRVRIKLFTNSDYTNDIIKISIKKSLDEKDLTNVTKMLDSNSEEYWIEFDFEDISVNVGEPYYIVCSSLNNTQMPNCYYWFYAWFEGIKPGPYQDGCSYYSNDRHTWLNTSSFNDDFCFITYGYNDSGAKSDLECIGKLNWNNISAGETVKGNFSISNIGFAGSLLDWNISEYPNWGNWTIYPPMGNDLTPSDGKEIIHVTMIVPDEKNQVFNGQIKIVNTEDSSDFETIVVSLSTSKTKENYSFFLQFLENHPHLFPLIRQILGL